MSDIVSPLLQWLNANPQLAGLATFTISAAESVAIIGTIVPGSVTMTAIGTLAGAGIIPLYETILWAILGAVVGDGISYWMGYHFKDRLRNMWPFKNNPSILQTGETFVHKYGTMSVFIGRFVGPVRALVPLVAGMLGMKPLQFIIANVASAIGWAPVYMLPGILLGAASLELPPDIAIHVILVLFLIFLFIILCLWVGVKLIQFTQNQIEQFLVKTWEALKRSRYFHIATSVLKHHNPNKHHGQLTRLFYFLLTSFLFALLVWYVHRVGSANIGANDIFYHFFRSIRTESVDNVMLNISLLGQKQIILPVLLVLFLWLVITKRKRAAFHAIALGILAAGSVYVLKNLMQSPRPWGIMQSSDTFSLPSGHTTLATTVYMGLAFIIASNWTNKKRRRLIYIPAILITLAVGISRMYLGAHWFTDVLAAWLLSTALLIVIILSYHRQKEQPIPLFGITIVGFLSLCICFGFYHHLYFNTLKTNYSQLEWPTVEISLHEWWKKDDQLPALRVNLFGLPSQRLNIQWAGELSAIKKTLLSNGWEAPPARNWESMLHRVADIQSVEYLPLISSQYLDKKPALILVKYFNDGKRMLVLRLWASHRFIKETQQALWVGTVGFSPRPYSWLFRKSQREIQINNKLVFPDGIDKKPWESKTIIIIDINGKKHPHQQKILLIRKK
jgi:membrane protein DedA with SNARE-associated domain/membrane-associated phospholipid phosphatase